MRRRRPSATPSRRSRPACAGREPKDNAAASISLLIDHARRDIESGGDEDNLAWRRDLAWLANQLERHRGLTAQVPCIARALRRLPLPELMEPEELYEPEYDYEYEPPYP